MIKNEILHLIRNRKQQEQIYREENWIKRYTKEKDRNPRRDGEIGDVDGDGEFCPSRLRLLKGGTVSGNRSLTETLRPCGCPIKKSIVHISTAELYRICGQLLRKNTLCNSPLGSKILSLFINS